jgi:BetI-type transcriptional repressor, C-terminal
MWVLRRASRRPSFGAELELWGAARTDHRLREALRAAERGARKELYAVIDGVFGPEIVAAPCYPLVVELTVQLMRGLAISAALHERVKEDEPLIDQWAQVVRSLLAADSPPT